MQTLLHLQGQETSSTKIARAAVYEPPIDKEVMPKDFLPRLERELREDRPDKAMITMMLGAEMAPPLVRAAVPRRILEWGVRQMAKKREKAARPQANEAEVEDTGVSPKAGEGESQPKPGLTEQDPLDSEPPLDSLLRSFPFEMTMVSSASDIPAFAGMTTPTLLMGGTKSPQYLKEGLSKMFSTLPNARLIEFRGLDHLSSGNRDIGAKPETVATALAAWFAGEDVGVGK